MRFSALQESGIGADLGQNRLPDDADESMMAATGEAESSGGSCPEEGSVISNLPLLFADGYPTSLDKITLLQLERFITFMVQCSFGHDTAKVIEKPQWWPKEVEFSNPFVRPKKINENWMGNLKKLVFRCYTYHRSEYLLRFCSYLAQHPHDKLQYVNNWDTTTSLYHKSTGQLLVTFRNENMDYDRKIESPRRSLLPRNGIVPGSATKSKQQQKRPQTMVQPICDDIYLCDNCDAEFDGLQKMKEHEKLCCEPEPNNENSRPGSPEVAEPQTVQNQFLEYFKLASNEPRSEPAQSTETAANVTGKRTSRRIRGAVNLARCPTIPFSSPAGIAMAKKSRLMTEVTQQERLERIERYMSAPPLNHGSRPRWLDRVVEYNRWVVTHKPNRDKPPPKDNHVHMYNFNSFKRKPKLNIRSQLLYAMCRPCFVSITCLTSEQIEVLRLNPLQYKRPVRRFLCSKSRPASEFSLKPTGMSLKRKHPGNKSDPIFIIDDEDLATLTPIASNRLSGKISSISQIAESPTPVSAQTSEPSVKKVATRTTSQIKENPIAVIDLCSSDEEEDSRGPVRSDENRDPLRGMSSAVTTSILTNLSPSKLCVSPCIYPADSTSDWLKTITDPCGNVLNDDNDNRGNKYLGGVGLRARTCFPPVLRSAP